MVTVARCERAMAVKASKESQGFKLLQEDNLDDRPCPAVKKFVASVLDKKDIKDQDVAASFRNDTHKKLAAGNRNGPDTCVAR
nr:hypothetical protein BaRGS_005464 [Batillaria attramentaria]